MANKKQYKNQNKDLNKNLNKIQKKDQNKIQSQIAVYPGSFDPITFGHIDIIQRISTQFEKIVVLISESKEKNYLFTYEERKEFVERALKGLSNVSVEIAGGLTVNDCRRIKANTIVRGLRAIVDFEYEMTMANMNKRLAPEIETILVFASPNYYYVSSRGVKEVAKYGGSLVHFVPDFVAKKLTTRLYKPENKVKKDKGD